MKAILLALAVLSAGAGPAQAAGWSAAQTWPAGEDTVARVAVANDGSAALVVDSRRSTVLRVAAPGERFGKALRLKPSVTGSAVAAGPGGAVAAVVIRPGGMYATVRTAAGRAWTTRKIASEGKDPVINSVTIAHDPRGGWVVVESRFSRPNSYLQALTLSPAGARLGSPQSLGRGFFGTTARPTVALAIDSDGRAIFAADTPDPAAPSTTSDYGNNDGTTVFMRNRGGRFRGTFLGGGLTDARVAVGVYHRAAVVVTKSAACGDAGCRGAVQLFRVRPDNTVAAPETIKTTNVKKTSGPSVAFLGGDNAIVSWTQRGAGDGFSSTGAVQTAAAHYGDFGYMDARRTLDRRDAASEPIAMRLAEGRALVVWSIGDGVGLRGALVNDRGEAQIIAMPGGAGPARYHFNSTNRDVHTAGNWAAVAWNTADFKSAGQIKVSLRRFG